MILNISSPIKSTKDIALIPSIFQIIVLLTLFGQPFFSLIAFELGLPNRIAMLCMRGFVSLLCIFGIYFLALKKSQIFTSLTWPLLIIFFWAQYFLRLIYGFFFNNVTPAIPLWEFIAWGFGSSLLLSIAGYFFSSTLTDKSIAYKLTRNGLFLLAITTVLFGINPGFQSPYFGLPDLNPIPAGHAAASLSLLGISIVFNRNTNLKPSSMTPFISIILGIILIAYSGTRAAAIALISPFICLLIASKYLNIRINRTFTYVAFLISIFILLLSYILFVSPDIRLKIISTGFDPNSLQRLRMIQLSLQQFSLNPIFGSGFSIHTDIQNLASSWGESIFYPHNYLVESLALGGLVMASTLFYCWFSAAAHIVRAVRLDSEYLWLLFLFIQSTIYVMFSGHLGDVPIFWLILGISAGLNRYSNTDNSFIEL